jgi:hypothetical protein
MQIKDQWKYPRNWKVVTGAGALAAVGLAGFALTGPMAANADEDGIMLEERAQVNQTTIRAPLPANGVVDLSDFDDNDSPFDDNGQRGDADDRDAGSDDSPPRTAGGGGNDSVDASPDGQDQASPATPDQDSPDQGSPATPDQDSPDQASPATPDQDSPDQASPATPDQDSPDQASPATPDQDSPDQGSPDDSEAS